MTFRLPPFTLSRHFEANNHYYHGVLLVDKDFASLSVDTILVNQNVRILFLENTHIEKEQIYFEYSYRMPTPGLKAAFHRYDLNTGQSTQLELPNRIYFSINRLDSTRFVANGYSYHLILSNDLDSLSWYPFRGIVPIPSLTKISWGNVHVVNSNRIIRVQRRIQQLSPTSAPEKLNVVVVDSMNYELHSYILNNSTYFNYPAFRYPISVSPDGNAVYALGQCGEGMAILQAGVPNHICITKLDSNLNLIWTRSHGEGQDIYFEAYSVQATQDGGCIISGSKYDLNPNFVRNGYILKLDSDGNLISNIDLGPIQTKLNIYPNPSSGTFYLSALPQDETLVKVFNMAGQQCAEFKLNLGDNSFSLESYPQGTYIVQVWTGDKILDTKLVVKE